MTENVQSRKLLNASAQQKRVVKTAAEFAEAIQQRIQDIEIVDHLNLRTLNTIIREQSGDTVLKTVEHGRSIRGVCNQPPTVAMQKSWNLTNAHLVPRKPGQCIIVCDTDCLIISKQQQLQRQLWMTNLYFRFQRSTRSDNNSKVTTNEDARIPEILRVLRTTELYMSNVTLQGDGQPAKKDASRALTLPDPSTMIFCEDCIIDSVGGRQATAMKIGGSANFLTSTFQNNTIDGKDFGLFSLENTGRLMLRQFTLQGNKARYDVGKMKEGKVYASREQKRGLVVKPIATSFQDDLEYDDLLFDASEANREDFLFESDPFYLNVRNEFLGTPLPNAPGGDDDSLGTGAIIGIAAAGLVALLAIAAIIFVLTRRRKQVPHDVRSIASSEYKEERPRRPPSPGRGKSPFSSAAVRSNIRSNIHTSRASDYLLPDPTTSSVQASGGLIGTFQQLSDVKPPGPEATINDRMAWVHWQLDQFGEEHLILGKFRSLGPASRRQGGQAVVQFARSVLDQREYALKVFAVNHAYEAEAAMYKDESISGFLPRVEAMHDGKEDSVKDPDGHILSPCIVMEKGESLNEWSARAEPDLFMAIAVLANVALRLAEFHAAGYVHRDLKPANVMWLPRENRWTVIDFGCAAKKGDEAPLSFTLVYAAPEVVRAVKDHEKVIKADPALDTWALGVMAFELLSGEPAFHVLSDGKDEVMSQLSGDKRLPWEETGEYAADRLEALGVFKGAILQLLNRDAGLRPSMQRFYDAANRIFSSRTTIKI